MSRWSFGFKVHLICNKRGKPLNFMITPGVVDDRKPLKYKFLWSLSIGSLLVIKDTSASTYFLNIIIILGIFISFLASSFW